MTNYFDNNNLLSIILKWKKPLIILSLLAMVVSAIITSPFIIKPKYKSFAILYPANIIPFGTETPTEQMLQVLQSDDIRNGIINRFHLYAHYKIDTISNLQFRTDMDHEFSDNVNVGKTEYESVKLDVLDIDPVVANDIVNSMILQFNKKERTLQKEKSIELVKIIKTQLDKKKAEMDSMEDAIKNIRVNYGILDYGLQTRYATKEILHKGGDNGKKEETHDLIKSLKEKGGEFVSLNEHIYKVRATYDELKVQYENSLRDVEKDLTYSNVVTSPYPADKKTYPVRWLIMLISTCATLLFSVIAVAAIESYKEFRKGIEN